MSMSHFLLFCEFTRKRDSLERLLKNTYSFALVYVIADYFETFHDNETSYDGICGGNGRNDVTRHSYQMEKNMLEAVN